VRLLHTRYLKRLAHGGLAGGRLGKKVFDVETVYLGPWLIRRLLATRLHHHLTPQPTAGGVEIGHNEGSHRGSAQAHLRTLRTSCFCGPGPHLANTDLWPGSFTCSGPGSST
jgi:hypothetical protein